MLNLVFNQEMKQEVAVKIYTIAGQLVQQNTLEYVSAGVATQLPLNGHGAGYYVVHIQSGITSMSQGMILP
jgi:hypothetical protein